MSYSIYTTSEFKKLFKTLSKKYPSLKTDLLGIISSIKEKPDLGIHLGYGLHKIRMSITSKGKGKSAGARVITYLVNEDKEVYLVYIYDKSQLENISKEQIFELLRKSGLL